MSVPYMFVALQVYFPSMVSRHEVETFVAASSTCEFHIREVCIGGVPVDEHHSLYPGNATTSEAGNTTLGKTIKII